MAYIKILVNGHEEEIAHYETNKHLCSSSCIHLIQDPITYPQLVCMLFRDVVEEVRGSPKRLPVCETLTNKAIGNNEAIDNNQITIEYNIPTFSLTRGSTSRV